MPFMGARVLAVTGVAMLAAACSGLGMPVAGSGGPAQPEAAPLPRSVGPALPTSQAHATVQLPFEGGYDRWLTIVEASRSIPQGRNASVVWLPGLGTASVACAAQPEAAFAFTTWAKGEGPPHLRLTAVPAHGLTTAGGLVHRPVRMGISLARHIARAEARRQVVTHLQFVGGGEAFQFWVEVAVLTTATATRCDVLAEARVATHGAFKRYAPGHRLY
jgi:hypothetical protein